jgi:hypothetical protein
MHAVKYGPAVGPALTIESADLRGYYQTLALRSVRTIARHWRFVISSVGIALVFGAAVTAVTPRKYSAVALVYPVLFSETAGSRVPRANIDASSLVASEVRLLTSDALLGEAVRQLGLETSSEFLQSDSMASDMVKWLQSQFLPETRNYSPYDRALAMLRNKLEVAKDPRSYFITLSFTGPSPDRAASIVNAVALEYRRDKAVRQKQSGVLALEAELAQQLASRGEMHPKVLQVQRELDGMRAALAIAALHRHSGLEVGASDESVKLAIANRTPSGPKGLLNLGASLLVGLAVAMALVVWCERRGLEPYRLMHDMAHHVETKRMLSTITASLVFATRVPSRVHMACRTWVNRRRAARNKVDAG